MAEADQRDAIREAVPIDQASNHVTDQVAPLLISDRLRRQTNCFFKQVTHVKRRLFTVEIKGAQQ